MLRKNERPELPHREDFYYDFEYTLENIEAEFQRELAESKFQPEDKKRIEAALAKAKKLHKGQARREAPDLPYIVHPIEVATEVLRLGGSPNQVIASLFHDVREDVKWMRKLAKGKVAKEFDSRVVELLTRLLSKYRLEIFGFSGKTGNRFTDFFVETFFKTFINVAKVRRLNSEEYFDKLEKEAEAVFIKAIDRRKNLMSLGRMLDIAIQDDHLDLKETIHFVRRQINQTTKFVFPVIDRNYATLARNLETFTLKLEIRLEIAEKFLLQDEASGLEDALLPGDAVCDAGG